MATDREQVKKLFEAALGAIPIQDGDEVECRIDGFEPLKNPVIDLKRAGAR